MKIPYRPDMTPAELKAHMCEYLSCMSVAPSSSNKKSDEVPVCKSCLPRSCCDCKEAATCFVRDVKAYKLRHGDRAPDALCKSCYDARRARTCIKCNEKATRAHRIEGRTELFCMFHCDEFRKEQAELKVVAVAPAETLV